MAGVVIQQGFGKFDSENIRVVDTHQKNSELATWGMINAISSGMVYIGEIESAKFEISGLEPFGLINIVNRHYNFFEHNVPIASCFSGLKIQTIFLLGLYGTHLDISYCECLHILIESSQLNSLTTTGLKSASLSISNCTIGSLHGGGEEIKRMEVDNSQVPLSRIGFIGSDNKYVDSGSYIRSYDADISAEELVSLKLSAGGDEEEFHQTALVAIASMKANGWIE